MPETTEDFAALLTRARAGDQEALATLVQQYESKLRVVARVLLGPALRPYLDSLDLVQSVHRSLMLGLREDKFDISTPENLLALAMTMVRRKAARQWRHLKRQQRLETGSTETGTLPDVLASLSTPEEDPARTAQANDQIERWCANLNETERRLVGLRVQGYNLNEIARELGLSDVALRVRLTRLRQRLRAASIFEEWL
jgi:RNA polymerase sigma-70 factor (ECF subfamily)